MYGIVVNNDANRLQIDENYPHFVVSQWGTAASEAEILTSDFGLYPHVFIKPVGDWPNYGRPYNIGRSPRDRFAFENMLGSNYQYAVCSTVPGPMHTGTYGIKVNDGSGNTTFDSRRIQPLVRNILSLQPSYMTVCPLGRYPTWEPASELPYSPGNYTDVTLPDSSGDWWVSIPRGPIGYDLQSMSGTPEGPFEAYVAQVYVRWVAANRLRFGWGWLYEPFVPTASGLILTYPDTAPTLNLIAMIAKLR